MATCGTLPNNRDDSEDGFIEVVGMLYDERWTLLWGACR